MGWGQATNGDQPLIRRLRAGADEGVRPYTNQSLLLVYVFVDGAAFHDEVHVFKGSDVS